MSKTTSHSLHGFTIYVITNVLNAYKGECYIDNCYICVDGPLQIAQHNSGQEREV